MARGNYFEALVELSGKYMRDLVQAWARRVMSDRLVRFDPRADVVKNYRSSYEKVCATRNSVLFFYSGTMWVFTKDAEEYFEPKTYVGGVWYEWEWYIPIGKRVIDLSELVEEIHVFPGTPNRNEVIARAEKAGVTVKEVKVPDDVAFENAKDAYLAPLFSELQHYVLPIRVKVGRTVTDYPAYVASNVINELNGTLDKIPEPELIMPSPEELIKIVEYFVLRLRENVEYLITANKINIAHFVSVYELLTGKQLDYYDRVVLVEKLKKAVHKELIKEHEKTIDSMKYYAKKLLRSDRTYLYLILQQHLPATRTRVRVR